MPTHTITLPATQPLSPTDPHLPEPPPIEECKAIDKECRSALRDTLGDVQRFHAALRPMYERRAFIPLGHDSFKDYLEKGLGISKQQGYRILAIEDMILELGDASLSHREVAVLQTIPKESRAAVLIEAKAAGEDVTPAALEAAAASLGVARTSKKGGRSGKSSSRTSSAKEREPGHPDHKDDEKLTAALDRIQKLCGVPGLKKHLIEGTVDLSKKDILFWAEQKEAMVVEMEKLITVNRWTPTAAVKFLKDVPDAQSKVEELKHRAIAARGAYSATIGGFLIVALTPEAVKKHGKAIEKLIGG